MSEAIGATPFEPASVSELEMSSQKSPDVMEYNSNVVRWVVWRKKVVGMLVIPSRKRVLMGDESMIFESASFISLLKEFQSQGSEDQSSERFNIISQLAELHEKMEKDSRQQNGSWRMASSDGLFIHLRTIFQVISLTNVWMTGFWTRSWWILWQSLSFVIEISENRYLRLGKRKEEETRLHCLSDCVSYLTAAITLSMMSCGISIDFAICELVQLRLLFMTRIHSREQL